MRRQSYLIVTLSTIPTSVFLGAPIPNQALAVCCPFAGISDLSFCLFEHRGRIPLIGDHKDKNLGTAVRTRIARCCMDRSWWLVKRIAGLLDDTGLPVDRKFDHSLQDVSKRVVSRMAMPCGACIRPLINNQNTDLSARQIAKRLSEQLPRPDGGRLGR